jgi:hypothetical protein
MYRSTGAVMLHLRESLKGKLLLDDVQSRWRPRSIARRKNRRKWPTRLARGKTTKKSGSSPSAGSAFDRCRWNRTAPLLSLFRLINQAAASLAPSCSYFFKTICRTLYNLMRISIQTLTSNAYTPRREADEHERRSLAASVGPV